MLSPSLTFLYFWCQFTTRERCQIKTPQAEVIYTATDTQCISSSIVKFPHKMNFSSQADQSLYTAKEIKMFSFYLFFKIYFIFWYQKKEWKITFIKKWGHFLALRGLQITYICEVVFFLWSYLSKLLFWNQTLGLKLPLGLPLCIISPSFSQISASSLPSKQIPTL